jgi:hypothetical protein
VRAGGILNLFWLCLIMGSALSSCSEATTAKEDQAPQSRPVFPNAVRAEILLINLTDEDLKAQKKRRFTVSESDFLKLNTLISVTNISVAKSSVYAPACFIPHHEVTYFDRNNKKIGSAQICFCCDDIRIEGAPQPARGYQFSVNYQNAAQWLEERGIPSDIAC